jgi:acetolactate synthase regulatory subunit
MGQPVNLNEKEKILERILKISQKRVGEILA